MLWPAAQRLSETLFGGSCFLCRGRSRDGILCAGCRDDLPHAPRERCPQCALASPASRICGRCLAQRPHYDATCAALVYAFPVDVIVHALKYRGELALATLAAELIARCIDGEEPVAAMVPVPLSAARLRERGYNQSMEIARHLSRALGVKLAPGLCERIRDTAPQMSLPLSERRRNVRGAFCCRTGLPGGTIAVVDDVMTSATTLDEIARELKQAGALRVVNWVLARTPPPAHV